MHNLELLTFLIVGGLITYTQMKISAIFKSMGLPRLWLHNTLSLLAIVLIGFGILWAASSLLEHETQAAMMGIIIFGGMGVILGIVEYRMAVSQK